jgi:hypothetical protein
LDESDRAPRADGCDLLVADPIVRGAPARVWKRSWTVDPAGAAAAAAQADSARSPDDEVLRRLDAGTLRRVIERSRRCWNSLFLVFGAATVTQTASARIPPRRRQYMSAGVEATGLILPRHCDALSGLGHFPDRWRSGRRRGRHPLQTALTTTRASDGGPAVRPRAHEQRPLLTERRDHRRHRHAAREGAPGVRAGDYRWVAEVVNHAVFADPDNQAAKDLQADALEQ